MEENALRWSLPLPLPTEIKIGDLYGRELNGYFFCKDEALIVKSEKPWRDEAFTATTLNSLKHGLRPTDLLCQD